MLIKRTEREARRGALAAAFANQSGGGLDRSVALKVLPPEFLHDRTFASRFALEARVAAQLQHRNIVPIYATNIDAGTPWMSMRLLNGGTLADLLKANSHRLSMGRTVGILG